MLTNTIKCVIIITEREVSKMEREINFDMDGTLVNFYGVQGWLECLMKEDTKPYREAKPLINFSVLARVLNKLQNNGWKINIISWLSKNGSAEYNTAVTLEKLAYLEKHLPSVKWNKITIVEYGTPKSTCGNGILFDDEEPNRIEWKGIAYDVDKIMEVLKALK